MAGRRRRGNQHPQDPAWSLSRRAFLRGAAAATGGLATLGGLQTLDRLASPAHAAEGDGDDIHYIFCYFSGGWDILLSLDPREPYPDGYREEYIDNYRVNPGYELIDGLTDPIVRPFGDDSLRLGAYVGALADPAVAQHCLVVRGMSMETLTHEVGRRRFLTGRPPSGLTARGSSADTWLAASLGDGKTIPNLSLNVESYNEGGEHPGYASALRTSSLNDLLRVLNPGKTQLSADEDALIETLLTRSAGCPGALESQLWQQAERSRQMSKAMIEAGVGGAFDFFGDDPAMEAIRAHYGLDALSGSERYTAPEVQAATAVSALTQGISRCVSVRIANGLDTHFDNWASDNGPNQQRGFDAIASMIRDLEARAYPDGSGDSWLDHTVIVGFSEFCRTPMLNASEGRDHWLLNSCLLAGGPIHGGRAIGQSSEIGMNPMALNLDSGALDEGGEVVRPEHIIQAFFERAGIPESEADLRVSPLRAIWKS